MSNLDTFQRGEILGIDVDEEYYCVTRPVRVRSRSELDIITQEISRALRLERVVAQQITIPVEIPAAAEIEPLLIEQPNST